MELAKNCVDEIVKPLSPTCSQYFHTGDSLDGVKIGSDSNIYIW